MTKIGITTVYSIDIVKIFVFENQIVFKYT